jgi:hypothetical protein
LNRKVWLETEASVVDEGPFLAALELGVKKVGIFERIS